MRVNIVDPATDGPDKGVAVAYHPPQPESSTFANEIKVAHDCTVDTQYPEMNFNSWCAQEEDSRTNVMAVSGTQLVIMRWELSLDSSPSFPFLIPCTALIAFSSVVGRSRIRTPTTLEMALAMDGAVGTQQGSATPLAPKGPILSLLNIAHRHPLESMESGQLPLIED